MSGLCDKCIVMVVHGFALWCMDEKKKEIKLRACIGYPTEGNTRTMHSH